MSLLIFDCFQYLFACFEQDVLLQEGLVCVWNSAPYTKYCFLYFQHLQIVSSTIIHAIDLKTYRQFGRVVSGAGLKCLCSQIFCCHFIYKIDSFSCAYSHATNRISKYCLDFML